MDGVQSADVVRRRLLLDLSEYTGRNTIIYATGFLEPGLKPVWAMSINPSDKLRFREVMTNLTGDRLDVVLESPGGSPDAAESIVQLLRSKFKDIRFIVPNLAKSAATMLALSGNQIIMDEHSELGPTDPQLAFQEEGKSLSCPAQAILDQFARASGEISKDPSQLPAWIPILKQYGPSLLQQCENAIELTRSLVSKWLETYMFAGRTDARERAAEVSDALANSRRHLSHGRMIGLDDALALNLNVIDSRDFPELQRKVWDLYVAIQLTFKKTGAVKIVENQRGDAVIDVVQAVHIAMSATPDQGSVPPPSQSNPPLNRQQRRKGKRH
jgi:hypothetical protein